MPKNRTRRCGSRSSRDPGRGLCKRKHLQKGVNTACRCAQDHCLRGPPTPSLIQPSYAPSPPVLTCAGSPPVAAILESARYLHGPCPPAAAAPHSRHAPPATRHRPSYIVARLAPSPDRSAAPTWRQRQGASTLSQQASHTQASHTLSTAALLLLPGAEVAADEATAATTLSTPV